MYTTTFPCHDCAKHIVAAGIERVVYIEPYPKSLVPDLYLDSIAVDSPIDKNHVAFQSFVGISPRCYMDLFSMTERKQKDGNVKTWDKSKAVPRLTEYSPSYVVRLLREQGEFIRFEKQLIEKGLRE